MSLLCEPNSQGRDVLPGEGTAGFDFGQSGEMLLDHGQVGRASQRTSRKDSQHIAPVLRHDDESAWICVTVWQGPFWHGEQREVMAIVLRLIQSLRATDAPKPHVSHISHELNVILGSASFPRCEYQASETLTNEQAV